MPLHRIFHPPGIFSAEDKQGISERITAMYTAVGLPAFYVVVIFTPVPEDSFFVGAKPVTTDTKFVRIVTSHLARQAHTPEQKAKTLARLENAFAPYIKDRGFDWELHIEEHDRDLWHLNGLAPPLPNTEAEKTWAKLNKAVPFQEAIPTPHTLPKMCNSRYADSILRSTSWNLMYGVQKQSGGVCQVAFGGVVGHLKQNSGDYE